MNFDEMSEPGNLLQAKKDWEALFSNRAWIQLQQALQQQADGLQNAILFGAVSSSGDGYVVERQKGNLEGRLSISGTALAMYESVCADLQANLPGDQNVEE